MNSLQLFSNEEFVVKSANVIADIILGTIKKDGTCILGLSGGSTPGPVYAELGKNNHLDWKNVKIFLIDERFISASDDRSNLKLIRSTLLQGGNVSEENILFPDTSLPLHQCVSNYDSALRALLHDRPVDIAVLGLGEDGHTASLFPGDTSALNETERCAIHTTTDHFEIHERITVTLPVLKNTLHPLLLIKGQKKLDVLNEMEKSHNDYIRWPLTAIGEITVLHQE